MPKEKMLREIEDLYKMCDMWSVYDQNERIYNDMSDHRLKSFFNIIRERIAWLCNGVEGSDRENHADFLVFLLKADLHETNVRSNVPGLHISAAGGDAGAGAAGHSDGGVLGDVFLSNIW